MRTRRPIDRAQVVVDELTDGGPTMHLVHDNFRNLGRILDSADSTASTARSLTSDGMASSSRTVVDSHSVQTNHFS